MSEKMEALLRAVADELDSLTDERDHWKASHEQVYSDCMALVEALGLPSTVTMQKAFEVVKALRQGLHRRGDEDLREATAQPVFLIQRRRLVVTEHTFISYDSDSGTMVLDMQDGKSPVLTEEDVIARGWGQWEWDVWRVGFERKACEELAEAKKHDGPFRVYSVPASGKLVDILKTLTDYEPDDA